MEEEKIKCIYYIKDNRTDKIIYIGQTIDFKGRKAHHFKSKKTPIDKHMFEEGRKNFSMLPFDIDVAEYNRDELKNKENELILYYNTIEEGFNCCRSGIYNIDNDYEYRKKYRDEYMKEYRKEYYLNHIEYFKEYYKHYIRKR